MTKDDRLYLAQAVPWLILLALWVLAAIPLFMLTSAVKLVAWTLASLARLVEYPAALLLGALFLLRPTRGGQEPKDPTATAPVTGA